MGLRDSYNLMSDPGIVASLFPMVVGAVAKFAEYTLVVETEPATGEDAINRWRARQDWLVGILSSKEDTEIYAGRLMWFVFMNGTISGKMLGGQVVEDADVEYVVGTMIWRLAPWTAR